MKPNTFQYSLRVWLTSVAGASLIYVIILALKQGTHANSLRQAIGSMFSDWLFFASFQLVFSLATWLLFYLIVRLIVRSVQKPVTRRWLIFCTGIMLTLVTFKVTILQDGFFNDNNWFAYLMLADCFCIGAGTWLYELRPPEYLNWV